MKKAICFRAVPIIFVLLCLTTPVFADIAPPQQPSGGNPGLSEPVDTMVEMSYEVVFIEVGEVADLFYTDVEFESVNAHVNALFLMENRGGEAENLDVVFPLTHPRGSGDGRFNFPEIRNFTVSVNESQKKWILKETPNQNREGDPPIKWAEFTINFPPGEVVAVEVSYDVQSTGYFPEATFYYVFETGAGWYGPIGEAVVYMTLPYEATDEVFLFGNHNIMGFYQKTTENPTYEGNRARWHLTDFEPEPGDNWDATIIEPQTWQAVLDLRERIDGGDELAYSEITKVYDYILSGRGVRAGAEHFVPINLEMYENAIAVEPDNDDVFARYADFLMFLDWSSSEDQDYEVDLWTAYDAAVHALTINPENETAQRVKRELENFQGLDPENRDQAAGEADPDQKEETPDPEKNDKEMIGQVTLTVDEKLKMDDSKSGTSIYFLAAGIVLAAAAGIFWFQRRLKQK